MSLGAIIQVAATAAATDDHCNDDDDDDDHRWMFRFRFWNERTIVTTTKSKHSNNINDTRCEIDTLECHS